MGTFYEANDILIRWKHIKSVIDSPRADEWDTGTAAPQEQTKSPVHSLCSVCAKFVQVVQRPRLRHYLQHAFCYTPVMLILTLMSGVV